MDANACTSMGVRDSGSGIKRLHNYKNKGENNYMKLATKILVLAGMASMLVTKPMLAGDGKTFKDKVVVEEARKWWGASLSTGWDSLYMFRGVNVLRFGNSGKQQYGSSLYWTQLNLSFMPTANDTITLG